MSTPRNFKIPKANSFIEGPIVISYTRQGVIPHIAQPSTIVSPTTTETAYYLPVEHFIDLVSPSLPPSSNRTLPETWSRSNVHEYCKLPKDLFVVASTFEPVRSKRKDDWVVGSSKAIGLVANSGNRILMSPGMLAQVSQLLKPNALLIADPSIRLFNGIGDHGNIQQQSSDSQERKAHTKWIKFVETLLDSNSSLAPYLWACVGGSRKDGIKHSFLNLKESFDDKIAAYGLVLPTPSPYTEESDNSAGFSRDAWTENLDTFCHHVESINKPRFLIGASSFRDIALAISKGIDIVDDSWIEEESLKGRALFVDFTTPLSDFILESKEKHPDNGRVKKMDSFTAYFDLMPTGKRATKKYGQQNNPSASGESITQVTVKPVDQWKLDVSILDSNCSCWTCTRPHTRAYIHHLLCVNDMLSYVMLQHHNIYQLQKFVAQIRESITKETFEQDFKNFNSE